MASNYLDLNFTGGGGSGGTITPAADAVPRTPPSSQYLADSWLSPSIARAAYVSAVEQRAAKVFDGTGVWVQDYVPGGGALTNANFDAALRAAITAAYALCGAPDNGTQGGCNVYIPRGKWSVNSTVHFPGSLPFYTPGLIGEGEPGSVILEFPQNVYPWIDIGTINPSEPNQLLCYAVQQTIKNIELRPVGGVASRGGVRVNLSIFSSFVDVRVRGLSGVTGTAPKWNECIGFDFQQPPASSNIQHMRLLRCHADLCLIGYRFGETIWACTATDLHANGCLVAPAMYESGAVVSWIGGNTQCGPAGIAGNMWWEGTPQAVHCSGALYTTGLPSGTGATLSAPTSGLCTLTGLTGLSGYRFNHSVTHKGCWIELINPSPPSPDLASGLYRIEEVLSATSCTIRKGNGTGGSGLNYQVRGGGGSYNLFLNGIYHEGGAYALASFGPDWIGASRLNIQSTEANNCAVVLEQTNSQGYSTIRNTFAPGGLYAKLRHANYADIDGDISLIDADTTSLACLVARKNKEVWDARPRQSRYNRALIERGAVFAVDARKASTIVGGASPTTWTDFIGSVVGTRLNAGVAPAYVASDAALGAPAIRLVGGASGTAIGGFQWDLSGRLRAKAGCTVIVVGRLPDTTVGTSHRMIGLRNTGAGDFHLMSQWNDGVYFPAGGNYASIYSADIGGSATAVISGDANTLAQAQLATSLMGKPTGAGFTSCGAGASDTVDYAHNANFGGYGVYEPLFTPNAPILYAPWYIAGTIGDLYVSHIAMFDRGVTFQESQQLIDLIRNEFNVAR